MKHFYIVAGLLVFSLLTFGQGNIQYLDHIDLVNNAHDYVFAVQTHDFDGDNDDDIIVSLKKKVTDPFSTYFVSELVWYENLGSSFSAKQNIFVNGAYPLSIEFIDLDNDLDDDILTTYRIDNLVARHGLGKIINAGNHTYSSFASLPPADSYEYRNIKAKTSDFDYDGDMDYVNHFSNVSSGSSNIRLYKNDGSGNFVGSTQFHLGGGLEKYFAVADLNGDNFDDYITYNSNNTNVIFYANDGAGNVGLSIPTAITVNQASEIYTTDIDGDLDIDIILSIAGQLHWYANDGSGNFGNAQLVNSDIVLGLKITDVDYDGDNDIVAFQTNNQLVWYSNNGSGNFTNYLIANTGILTQPESTWDASFIIECADFNNDGLQDAVMNSKDTNEDLNYYLNTLTATNTIKGKVYHDANMNQVQDNNESVISHAKLLLMPANIYTFTDNNGNYEIEGSAGVNNSISIEPFNNWSVTTDSIRYSFVLPLDPSDFYNFGLHPDVIIIDGSINVSSSVTVCEQTSLFTIDYLNMGSANSSVWIEFISPSTSFVSSYSITPSNVSPNFIRWVISSVAPWNSSTIDLEIELPGSSEENDTLIFICRLISFNPTDTILFEYKPVLLCQGPDEDKMVEPAGEGIDHETTIDSTLIYTIRFQNNGLSTISDIVIIDTLDNALDLSTFQLLNQSHNLHYTLNPTTREAKFYFTNIDLPSATVDEVGSQGFVTFEISPLSNLDVGIVVENTARISYDNTSVQTNTTYNTLVTDPISFVNQSLMNKDIISLYPNPMMEKTRIEIPEAWPAGAYTIEIVNIAGKVVKRSTINNSQQLSVSKNDLEPGLYLLNLYNLENKIVVKGIKLMVQ